MQFVVLYSYNMQGQPSAITSTIPEHPIDVAQDLHG